MTARRGFTLIELLVVIAIIALLIGILVPALGAAKRGARDTLCLANQRSMGTLVSLYVADHDEAYPYQPVDPSFGAFSTSDLDACRAGPVSEIFRDGDIVLPMNAPDRFASVLAPYSGGSIVVVQAEDENGPLFLSTPGLEGYRRMRIADGGIARCPRTEGGTAGLAGELAGEASYAYSKAFYHPPSVTNQTRDFLASLNAWRCPSPQRESSVLFPSLKILAGDEFQNHADRFAANPWALIQDDPPMNFLFPDGHVERVNYEQVRFSNTVDAAFGGRLRDPNTTIDGIRGRDLGGTEQDLP